MITGPLKSQIDRIWDAFWSGGVANPLEVIEQITCLLFIKRLDDLHTLDENKARRLGHAPERPVFNLAQQDYRWSHFKHMDPRTQYELLSEKVFPFIRTLGEGTDLHGLMADVRFTIPTPALLAKVVEMIDGVPMEDRDTKGDLYEYMLGKIASAGQNGQFRTPRHIIRLMVALTRPQPGDTICDPACGTAGFLVAAGEYLRDHHPDLFTDRKKREHFTTRAFNATDSDRTMVRVAAMNLLLHGIESPRLARLDALSEDAAGLRDAYTLILANPPFAGSLDAEACAPDLRRAVATKKTELLFLALILAQLKRGGRAAVIVPEGVLFGASKAHTALRRTLVEDHRLQAVIGLPGGVFKPYAGVSTAILLFTKTGVGGTDSVLFYGLAADGYSLDDKRTPLLPDDKLGVDATGLSPDELEKNNLPEVLARWNAFSSSAENGTLKTENSPSVFADRTGRCFAVSKADIVANAYDLSFNRYREVVHAAVDHECPRAILRELRAREAEIDAGLAALEDLLK